MSPLKEFDHLRIALEEIQLATNNFSDQNIIGQGGFGNVYKGQLVRCEKSIDVAVSRLDSKSDQGAVEFLTEISILSPLEHENLSSLIGFCEENGEKLTVNKLEVNGSLDKHLRSVTLTWMQRLHICVGAARALSYLHHNTGRNYSIIHRNIKSSKILLDENWNAKIGDCKLSLVNPAHRRHRLVLSEPAGTFGYMDPVYYRTGSVTYKSDSYSFGIVLFEVLCGRMSFKNEQDEIQFLDPLAKLHYEKGTLDEIIPSDLREQMDPQSLSIFSETAYYCLKKQRTQRPDMDQIARKLVKALEVQQKSEKPKIQEHPMAAVRTWPNHLKEKLGHLKIPLRNIKLATNDFNESECIGWGGYGMVYKAVLEVQGLDESQVPKRQNTVVAIKRILSRQDGEEGFFTEVEMLTDCRHPNIVSLVGFCDEDQELILIYEHASNKSLDDYLGSIDNFTNFTWVERLRMCLDIAQGLNYLHTKDERRIIHRDIKSANILLDRDWKAKIADFGLSKFGPMHDQVSYLQESKYAGTDLYVDPEYEQTGKLKRESDIYSFGVVLFEILCGRLAHDERYKGGDDKGLPSVVRRHADEGTLKEIIDHKVMEETDENMFTLNKGPNQESLDTFLKIACQCLAEKQVERPTMEVVIGELQKALVSQENHVDMLKIPFELIRLATDDFSDENRIGGGGFGIVYRGDVVEAHQRRAVAVKRHRPDSDQGEAEFLAELEILFEYKHENVIGLVGYCNDSDEKIIVYEYASHGSLDKYLSDASLTWTKRMKICIDVARGLNFFHGGEGGQERVIHRDIKSSNILLDANWKAKITDFGLSVIAPINEHMNHVITHPAGTFGYIDVQYFHDGILTKENDIFSLGVVLLEIMSGRLAYTGDSGFLFPLFKHRFEEGKADEIVFDGIKAQIVPESLTVFSKIVHQCLHDEIEQRPTAEQVMVQLKEALQLQEDYEIWEPKFPQGYREIIQRSKSPEIYLNENKRDLYDILCKGILLQNDKVWFSLSVDGMKNEMISASMFSYKNPISCKWSFTKNSRFPMVAEMFDISDMNIKIKITPQLLSPDIVYGAYVVFKFCDPIKSANKPVYVNLKYKMGNKTLHSYIARWRDDEWMMIELDRFLNQDNSSFDVLLESFSEFCCESGAIFIEGIEFLAIDNVKHGEMERLKEVETALEFNSNTDQVQRLPIHNDETIDKQLFSLRKANDKKCFVLPARMVLHAYSNMKHFNWISLAESRSEEVAVLQGQQVFRLKCKIETQRLSSDTDYACYLVFKLSQECHGLQCPVKVRDKLQRTHKESKVIYFRSPSLVNVHGMERIPKHREDELMEVIVWELKSSDDEVRNNDIPMNLKLKCYEGTMSGLIVCGVEFRPT